MTGTVYPRRRWPAVLIVVGVALLLAACAWFVLAPRPAGPPIVIPSTPANPPTPIPTPAWPAQPESE